MSSPLLCRLRTAGLLALWLPFALMAPVPAFAQEAAAAATPLERILDRPPPACTEGAFALLARQMRADAPRVVADNLRHTQQLGDAWAPGDPGYDRVRSLVATAFDDREQAGSPLVATSYRQLQRKVFGDMRPEILALLADVFERPGGQLYWDRILGGAECSAVLGTITADRLNATDRFSYDRFRRQAEAAHSAFNTSLPTLSPADRKDFDQAFAKMDKGVIGGAAQAAALVGASLQTGVRAALAPHQAEIRAVLLEWKAQHPAALPAVAP